MRIILTDHEGVRILQDIFGLGAPVAFEDVKKIYRAKSKEAHPDKGGCEEAQKALNVAFEKLKELYVEQSAIFAVTDKDASPSAMLPTHTTDGTPLCELGKGVKFNENGYDCDLCNGKGYSTEAVLGYRVKQCPSCSGEGETSALYDCRSCGGSGKFTQFHTRRVVDCRTCGGTGKFRHPFQRVRCRQCGGVGIVPDNRPDHYVAFKCHKCSGVGQIKILNPVLMNGTLAM